jgi:hypothetical protein
MVVWLIMALLIWAVHLGVMAIEGTWTVETTLDSQTGPTTLWDLNYSSTLFVSAEFPSTTLTSLAVSSQSVFDPTGYASQLFTTSGHIDLWEFYSELSFSKVLGGFDHWLGSASFSLGDVDLTGDLYLGSTPADTYAAAKLEAPVAGTSVAIDTRLEGCDLVFSALDVTVSGLNLSCADSMGIQMGLDHNGFVDAVLQVNDLDLGLVGKLVFDLELSFSATRKSVTLELAWPESFRPLDCVVLYTAAGAPTDSPSGISSISIYGLEWSATLGDVTFRNISVLDPLYASTLLDTDDETCWEQLDVLVTAALCEGMDVECELSALFSYESEHLFDWAEAKSMLKLNCAKGWSASLSLTGDANGLDSLGVSMGVAW